MEACKQELIKKILAVCGASTTYKCCDVDTVRNRNDYINFMNKMTFDEIVTFINGDFREGLVSQFRSSSVPLDKIKHINNFAKQLKHDCQHEILMNEIAAIKDQLQTTTDIVNLFTDIDKNRTNLEEQVNSLEQKINQILSLLQKS